MNETNKQLALLDSPLNLPDVVEDKRHVFFKKGESAFNSSNTLRYFYFVLNGKIKISQINLENAKEQTTHILTRGDMFDVVTLLDNKEHEYISMALEDSELIEVPLESIRKLIETNPAFNRYFFPYLAKQLRDMEALAVDLSLYDIYNRLLHLIYKNLDNSSKKLKLINNLSHEELASIVGTVRKVLTRNLQKLKEDGIIDLGRKSIEIKSLKELYKKLKY